jgi:hypothetical protein
MYFNNIPVLFFIVTKAWGWPTVLNYVPMTETQPPNTVAFSVNYWELTQIKNNNDMNFYNLRGGLPGFEFSLALATPEDTVEEQITADAKYRLIDDKDYIPALAFGLMNIGYNHPTPYIVGSKILSHKYLEPRLHLGYMWNIFGIKNDKGILLGIDWILVSSYLYGVVDYFGGENANLGLGLYGIISKEVHYYISYFIPDRERQSESIFIGIKFVVPVRFF